ncbi:hypothetical protein BgiMline_027932, partial [Biomphalaria glabrata]
PMQLALNVSCSSFPMVYKAETHNELLRLFLLYEHYCRVFQNFNGNFTPFECYRDQKFT